MAPQGGLRPRPIARRRHRPLVPHRRPHHPALLTGLRIAFTHNPGRSLDQIAAPPGSQLPLPRTLVILAHPDDEVLALGARLERFTQSRFLSVTDGAPANGEDARAHGFRRLAHYRRARRAELNAAFRHCGLPKHLASTLALPTRRHIPDQAAALHLVALTRALQRHIQTFRPDSILTHPYEGGHPDHDACAFAVQATLQLLRHPAPPRIEAPFYHAGPHGIVTGHFLPNGPAPITRELSPEQQRRKRLRLACFRTQTETLSQFRMEQEQFRLAPTYDFTQPPNPGQLFYEQFPWGLSGLQFRQLAAQALEDLGL